MIIVVAFHVGAYFYLHGGVHLYFIVRVEVIEIQIWFEFKLVWNLEKIWKFKSLFSVFYWPWAEFNQAGLACPPIPLSCTARIVANEA
jgi:hypothetical protein